MGIFTPSGQHAFPDLRTPAGSDLTEKLVTGGGLASDLPKLEGRSAPELEPSEQGHLPRSKMSQVHWQPEGTGRTDSSQFCGGVRRSPPAIAVHCGPPATGLAPPGSQQGVPAVPGGAVPTSASVRLGPGPGPHQLCPFSL